MRYAGFSQGLWDILFNYYDFGNEKDPRITILMLTMALLKAAGQKWGAPGRIKASTEVSNNLFFPPSLSPSPHNLLDSLYLNKHLNSSKLDLWKMELHSFRTSVWPLKASNNVLVLYESIFDLRGSQLRGAQLSTSSSLPLE